MLNAFWPMVDAMVRPFVNMGLLDSDAQQLGVSMRSLTVELLPGAFGSLSIIAAQTTDRAHPLKADAMGRTIVQILLMRPLRLAPLV